MADKYLRVEKPQERLPENEIRVKKGPGIARYLRRAFELLTGKVQGFDTVVIKGADLAMENVVKLAELVKHRVAGIHQVNSITNMTMIDEYEPLEEGLDHLKFERHLTVLTITLSKAT